MLEQVVDAHLGMTEGVGGEPACAAQFGAEEDLAHALDGVVQ